jgi:hypothetical protein
MFGLITKSRYMDALDRLSNAGRHVSELKEECKKREDEVDELSSLVCKWQGKYGSEVKAHERTKDKLAEVEKWQDRFDTLEGLYADLVSAMDRHTNTISAAQKLNHGFLSDYIAQYDQNTAEAMKLLKDSTDVKRIEKLEADLFAEKGAKCRLEVDLESSRQANTHLTKCLETENERANKAIDTALEYFHALEKIAAFKGTGNTEAARLAEIAKNVIAEVKKREKQDVAGDVA